MWSRIFAGILMSAACAAGAATMSAAHGTHGQCQLVGGEKLPKDAGGAASICAVVEQAVAARAPKVRYSAEVQVLSKSALLVNVEVNGRKLDQQHYSVMDRNLNPTSIKHFADAIAEEIVEAAKKG
jgi:hypothetical protein